MTRIWRVGAATPGLLLLSTILLLAAPRGVASQESSVVRVSRGNSQVVTLSSTLERVSIANPDIADVLPVSATEIVVNGIATGSTTLLVWGIDGTRSQFQIRVTPDVEELNDEIQRLFPRQRIDIRAVGTSIVLSGEVDDPQVAARALSLASSLSDGATVVDQISVPDRPQVLLQVRFAEVNRNALQSLGANVVRMDPFNPRGDDEGAIGTGGVVPFVGSLLGGDGPDQFFSDQVNFFLFQRESNVAALIRALRSQGLFQSLAEPNLLAVPGETATFLAGGEFPFPVLQGNTQAVSIQFREFGIRLAFTPEITNSGAIRMQVAPEVSSLDFGTGLTVSGFQIPTLLSRRAETVVELREGETFAIAGLMDNNLTRSVSKIPLLGDIPILGALFRSEDLRQNRTELLVLVTPYLVRSSRTPLQLPTGEPGEWDWFRYMRPAPGSEVPGSPAPGGRGQTGGPPGPTSR
jgi:pilus assembly protein CpaC